MNEWSLTDRVMKHFARNLPTAAGLYMSKPCIAHRRHLMLFSIHGFLGHFLPRTRRETSDRLGCRCTRFFKLFLQLPKSASWKTRESCESIRNCASIQICRGAWKVDCCWWQTTFYAGNKSIPPYRCAPFVCTITTWRGIVFALALVLFCVGHAFDCASIHAFYAIGKLRLLCVNYQQHPAHLSWRK